MNNPGNEKSKASRIVQDMSGSMADAITIMIAVCTGLAVAMNDPENSLRIAIAVTVAGSLVMGLGAYFTRKPEGHAGLKEKIDASINKEVDRTKRLLLNLDITPDIQTVILDDLKDEKAEWAEEILSVDESDAKRESFAAFKSGIIITIGFLIGGIATAALFYFFGVYPYALVISISVSLVILFIVALVKAKAFENKSSTAFTQLLTGVVAALASYIVAQAF